MRKKVLDLTISEAIKLGVLRPTYSLGKLGDEIDGNWYLPLLDANEEIEVEDDILSILKKHLTIKSLTPYEVPELIILSGGEIKDIKEAIQIKRWLEQ